MTSPLVERVPVVFVLDTMRVGGTELNAVRTAERLDRKRFDLRIVCLDDQGPLAERYRSMGIPVVTMPLKSLYGRSMFTSGRRFARYLDDERVQIVHAHDMYTNIFATPWALLARTPVIITSRRWWHSLPNRKLQLGNRAAFRMADAVLANSPQVARSVAEREGVPVDRIWHVTNFVDDEAFAPLTDEQRASTRVRWGIPDGALVIGCVARLVPVKDHGTLLAAFALVRQTCPAAHLVLIGDGESRVELEALAARLEMSGAVSFVGEMRDGANYHRMFDVSVLCSLSEGFPNSLVEAMAAGVPIVATGVGGILDAVNDGENGLLVPVQSAGELAGALSTLMRNSELRVSMGAAGSARARERYRAATAVRSLETMYERLLATAVR
jgi:glycosyltransferase involved in cell wall biosynthesis